MAKYFTREHYRKLNPEVYIEAANMIQSGEHSRTCNAVGDTLREFGISQRDDGHIEAWRAHFGPVENMTGHEDYEWSSYKGRVEKHPFWDKPTTWQRQNKRVDALLMMAEIVRQGKR